MQRVLVEEFYSELEATREDYVRKKFARGGYAGWKSKHAKTWLDQKEAEAKARREDSMRFWTMIAGIGAMGAVLIGVIALVGPHLKHLLFT